MIVPCCKLTSQNTQHIKLGTVIDRIPDARISSDSSISSLVRKSCCTEHGQEIGSACQSEDNLSRAQAVLGSLSKWYLIFVLDAPEPRFSHVSGAAETWIHKVRRQINCTAVRITHLTNMDHGPTARTMYSYLAGKREYVVFLSSIRGHP